MATFGEIRFQLSKIHPGVDHDSLDALILEGYQHVLAELDWQRLDTKTSIPIPVEYNAGTVAVTNGSASVVGTGTTWTTAMTGRVFRVLTDGAWYQFTFNSTTTATLDRPYEGTTATGAAYRINQNVFKLPSDCRGVLSVDGLASAVREEIPAARSDYGTPSRWVSYMDAYTDPPVMQIEVYPLPVASGLLAVSFTAESLPATLDVATGVLPWLHPAAIKAYVSAQVALLIEKNVALHQAGMGALAVHIAQMRKKETQGLQQQQLRPPVAHHRLARGTSRNRR